MKKNKKIVIFGCESFAEIVYYYFTHDSEYEVIAFTVTGSHIQEDKRTLFDLPVVPFEDVQDMYPPSEFSMYVAVGYVNVNKTRERFFHEAKAKGYSLATYVSTKATVFTDKIGENCFILEDNTVQPFVTIGDDVICWSGNHIGHHSKIEDHCYITSHVVISGHCCIKERSFLGVNATLRDNITIAEDNVIGAGAVILKNTKPRQVFATRTTEIFPRTSDQLLKL